MRPLGRVLSVCTPVVVGLGLLASSAGQAGSCDPLRADPAPGCIADVRAGFGEGSFQSGTIAGTTTALRSWPRPLTGPEVREMGLGVLALYDVTRRRYGGPRGSAGECRQTYPATTDTGFCDDCYRAEYGCLCGPHNDGRTCEAMEVDA